MRNKMAKFWGELSPTIVKLLYGAGIKSLDDLKGKSVSQLLCIKRIGRTRVNEIRAVCKRAGFEIKDHVESDFAVATLEDVRRFNEEK